MKECVKENILINKVNSMGNSVPNIYKKLNEFNAILGKSPKYKISMVADKHIYIKMIYKGDLPLCHLLLNRDQRSMYRPLAVFLSAQTAARSMTTAISQKSPGHY